jgi:hypothetical protein
MQRHLGGVGTRRRAVIFEDDELLRFFAWHFFKQGNAEQSEL